MNLYLIGYRGSGKSTVAPIVAEMLGRPWVDADDRVEERAEKSIADIFASEGEAHFRDLEAAVVSELASDREQVISLGGGAPMFERNRTQLTGSGKTVFLTAEIDVLWKRISGDQSTANRRPGLTDLDGRAEIETLLAKRNPVYKACADYTIAVDDLSPEEVAQQIVNWWSNVDRD